jgi:hypothetical protein
LFVFQQKHFGRISVASLVGIVQLLLIVLDFIDDPPIQILILRIQGVLFVIDERSHRFQAVVAALLEEIGILGPFFGHIVFRVQAGVVDIVFVLVGQSDLVAHVYILLWNKLNHLKNYPV